MARPFWFKIYAAEFLLDEKIDALPLEAQALLVRMWCLQARDGKVPADPAILARRICADANAVVLHMQVLSKFFTEIDGYLISPRLAGEQEALQKIVEERRTAAKSRWNKERDADADAGTDAKHNANGMQLHNGLHCKLKLESKDKTPPTRSLGMSGNGTKSIPAWVPVDSWLGFVAMRQRIKKPLTERGTNLIIGKLERLKAAGQDPGAILDESTMNSWAGVFPLKDEGKKPINAHRPTREIPSEYQG